MIVPVLLALHAALTIFGRLIVQARAGMLPVAWALVESASVVVPLFAAGLCSRPLSVAAVGIAALVAVVGVRIASQIGETLELADEGARERQARKMLRRSTPPETRRRALTPLTVSPELQAECDAGEARTRDALRSLHGDA
jgi:hypothetical protein